ncbi:coiled-coil domain-containing protein 159 isoform X2 [Elgaria multicarinata webbii]|uniref:coiled-coil domain-containing protein 159 isoform X2 n=1 Tax=Elgaria multicarinata webbii TaxID=159646 RepID=UPI002FCD5C12
MDALEGQMLVKKGSTMMTVAQDEKSRDISPTWCLARAGSTTPAGQLEIATVKPHVMIPESPMVLKDDVELIKAQLHAQTQAFQALSHSITLLEQESHQQQGRIKELEDEVQFAARSPHGEMLDGLMQKRIQEVWKAMSKEVEGLQGSMIQKESSIENLSQEVLKSKKFLWEELEAVQEDQEVDITRNLVSIKKMQENQIKCTKFLTQMRVRIPSDASEAVDNKPTSEELNDIWSAVNTLRNSITSCNTWNDRRGSSRMKGRANRKHRKLSSPGTILSDSALHQHYSSPEYSS